ncbi:MAG TPA: hypothetical protein GXX14_09290 [Clostridiaceae bacterium]|nr:hypothetical protein [Clostridiaceae bacterium]
MILTSRERIKAIFEGRPSDRQGFWLGKPKDETNEKYFEYFNVDNEDDLGLKLGNDIMWISSEWDTYRHPESKPMFDPYGGKQAKGLGDAGIFADVEDVSEIEKHEWPDPKYLDFSAVIERIDKIAPHNKFIFGGMWCSFFHKVCNYFGMENYFIKMHTSPKVVEAVTEKIVDFYVEANRRCFEAMGDKLDAFFFGNDFGSQENLLISPELFKRFIFPGFKRLVDLAKSYNLKVVLHSCGAISRIIPLLIEAGVDALHPLQAKAKGMDAETLAREFGKDLVFIGGVDTQELLPFGTPEEVKAEVRRLKKVFGERYIVSPSHEALLPNVSVENVIAMRDAAFEE